MPTYDLGNIMSFATANAGRRADIGESTVSRLANEAYFEVASAADPKELESVTTLSVDSGPADYVVGLPSDFDEPITATLIVPSNVTGSSEVSSWKTLEQISVAEHDASGSSTTGEPTGFAFFGGSMELSPSPESRYSLQLRYRAQPVDLTSTSSVPSISTMWRRAIVLKTEENIHRYVGDPASAQNANTRYLQLVSQLRSDAAQRQRLQDLPAMDMTAYNNRGRRKV